MKTLLILLTTLLLSGLVLADEDVPMFTVRAIVKADGANGTSGGSGAFTLPENEYGRIVLSFYRNGTSFRVLAASDHVGPVRHLSKEYYPQADPDGLTITVDLCLKARVAEDLRIRLSGLMTQMTRAQDQDEPLFTYSEEKIKCLLSSGGSEELTIESVSPWENIRVQISVTSSDQLVFEPKSFTEITFKGEYTLYNEDTRNVEMEEGIGTLIFAAEDGEVTIGGSHHKNTFQLPGGDSLMLMTTHDIGKFRWNKDGSATFEFELARYYAVNPYQADSIVHGGSFISLGEHGIAADRMTVTCFSRTITARPGERIKIEIPSDANNPLGFDFTERIDLVYTVKTVNY